jgi:hypothetical protein
MVKIRLADAAAYEKLMSHDDYGRMIEEQHA